MENHHRNVAYRRIIEVTLLLGGQYGIDNACKDREWLRPKHRLIIHEERRGGAQGVRIAFLQFGLDSILIPPRSHTVIKLRHIQSNLSRVSLEIIRRNRYVVLIDGIVKFPKLALLVRALSSLRRLGRKRGNNGKVPPDKTDLITVLGAQLIKDIHLIPRQACRTAKITIFDDRDGCSLRA